MTTIWNQPKSLSGQNGQADNDRQAAVAGRFYPANSEELRKTLHQLFDKAAVRSTENVRAVIVPHAGYIFSGGVAASGYNQIDPEKEYENVFLIASSHQIYFDGASVYTEGDYMTPLGRVPVNKELARKLIREHKIFTYWKDADKTEHSTEVQVPFLQYHLKKPFRLVPIVIGGQSKRTCSLIAKALAPWFNEKNLFVISTDFSHYPSYADAKVADQATCDAIAGGSSDQLLKMLEEYAGREIPNLSTNLCGWTSVVTLLELTGGDKQYKIIPVEYKNSGDSPYGEKSQVVGYWSLAVSGPSSSDFDFTVSEKKFLLKMARETIIHYLSEGKVPTTEIPMDMKNLSKHAGAFVTLKKKGGLRGCIGRFSSEAPLDQVVRQMAVASATQDSRFPKVTLNEVSELEIEISVLSPMRKVSSSSEIIPGKHGIYMKKGYATGTFLPQVATEQDWTLEEMLGHCARDKAGIGWDGWKTAELFVYEAVVFSEHEFTGRKD